MRELSIPLKDEDIRSLIVGESVSLSGRILTGRDAAHKWITETFISRTRKPDKDDLQTYKFIKPILNRGIIYHCGPIVTGLETKCYHFTAAGPTTSIRMEPYQDEIIRHFNIKGVIGKGGMEKKTLASFREVPGVYFHAIGGASSLIAQSITNILEVYKLDLGAPEAMWVIQIKDMPVVVTMDAHGNSLHDEIMQLSKKMLGKFTCPVNPLQVTI